MSEATPATSSSKVLGQILHIEPVQMGKVLNEADSQSLSSPVPHKMSQKNVKKRRRRSGSSHKIGTINKFFPQTLRNIIISDEPRNGWSGVKGLGAARDKTRPQRRHVDFK